MVEFIQKVENSIDLDATKDPLVVWQDLRSLSGGADILDRKASEEARKADDEESLTSSSSRSDGGVDAQVTEHAATFVDALLPYPVQWHIAEVVADDFDYPGAEKWSMYKHCRCDGSTRYYLRGLPFEAFAPPVITARPPCCFAKAVVKLVFDPLQQQYLGCVLDGDRHLLLAARRAPLPHTYQADRETRDFEERMIGVLAQNIWWIAHERCRQILIDKTPPQQDQSYTPASSTYHTQLAIPTLFGQKTSLANYCQKLNAIYPHLVIRI